MKQKEVNKTLMMVSMVNSKIFQRCKGYLGIFYKNLTYEGLRGTSIEWESLTCGRCLYLGHFIHTETSTFQGLSCGDHHSISACGGGGGLEYLSRTNYFFQPISAHLLLQIVLHVYVEQFLKYILFYAESARN